MGLAATQDFDWPAANIAAGTRAPTRQATIVTLSHAIWSEPEVSPQFIDKNQSVTIKSDFLKIRVVISSKKNIPNWPQELSWVINLWPKWLIWLRS